MIKNFFDFLLTKKRAWLTLFLVFVLTCAVFYGYYFITKFSNLDIVYKNWDGPDYVLAAMSLYKPEIAYQNNFIQSVDIHPDWTWLPAHFPLYPLLIRAFSFVGYFPAMLGITLVFTFLTYIAFYELAVTLKITRHPLLLTLPLVFLTPRWFIVSHTGSSEPIFLFFILLFLRYLSKIDHLRAALYIALATATRPQGAVFGLGLAVVALIELIRTHDLKKVIHNYYPYLSIPVTIILIFTFFRLQTGSFWAFFESIAIFKNFQPLPFQTFTFPNINLETFWQEVNAYDYVIFLAASLLMFRKKFWRFGVISLVYFLPLIFLRHSDISRYAIPLLPFAFLAYSEIIEKKEFTLATFLMSPAIIMYAINFMDHNHGR